jgi:hypothetical protein
MSQKLIYFCPASAYECLTLTQKAFALELLFSLSLEGSSFAKEGGSIACGKNSGGEALQVRLFTQITFSPFQSDRKMLCI